MHWYRTFRRAFMLGVVLGLAGCASAGVKVSEQEAQSFVVGKSTYSDVVAKLGEPNSSNLNSDGTRVAVYSYTGFRQRPESFIPYIGPFIAGADVKTSSVTFEFDKSGILAASSSSQGQTGSGQFLTSGSKIQRGAPQR